MTNLQTFNADQLHNINKGSIARKELIGHINDALNNNEFNENFIVSSLPGLGKTHEMDRQLKKMKQPPLVFNGDGGSFYTYFIDVATAIFLNGGVKNPMTVINDDCDLLFHDNIIGTTKKMFDNTRILRYGKNYKSLKSFCSDVQWEALESFADDSKAGIDLDVSNITFITLTNMHLNSVDEVEAQEEGSPKYNKYNARYSIRRRTNYEEIAMAPMDLWGYVADVVLNDQICEKFIPNIHKDYKVQILQWLYGKWTNGITERNLSIVEKMTKDIKKYPQNYLDIWEKKYVKV